MRLLLSLTCVFGNSSYGADRGEILDKSSIRPSIKYLGESKEGVQTPFQIVSREVWETPPNLKFMLGMEQSREIQISPDCPTGSHPISSSMRNA